MKLFSIQFLFLIYRLIQGIVIEIKRGFILEEDTSKEIVKDSIYHANTLPLIELAFGEPKQKVIMAIDTFTLYSWIWIADGNSGVSKYNTSLSSTYNDTIGGIGKVFEYNLCKMRGIPASDVLWIRNEKVSTTNKFGFVSCTSVNNDILNIDGYISLSKSLQGSDSGNSNSKSTNTSKSNGLIQYLMNEKYINNTIFSIHYTSNTKGVLRIGSIDPYITEESISYCSMKDNNKTKGELTYSNQWECRLYLITFGSYVQSNNSTVIFGFGQEHIFAPIEHIGLIDAIKLEAEKYSSNCFIRERDKVITLKCESFDLSMPHFQSLELQLKTYRLIIKPIDLFVWSEEEEDLLECVVHINKHMSSWLLGDPGLKREYVIFDSMNDKIGFVDKEFVVNNLQSSFFTRFWIYFAVWLFFSVAGYYMFVLQKRNKRKSSRKPNDILTQFVN